MKESVAMLHWVFFMCDARRDFLSNVSKGDNRAMVFAHLPFKIRVTERREKLLWASFNLGCLGILA